MPHPDDPTKTVVVCAGTTRSKDRTASVPSGKRVADLERRAVDSGQVVRTLNELQNAGMIRIQVEHKTHELVAQVPDNRIDALRLLLTRVGE